MTAHHAQGNLLSLTDPEQNTTTWTYDALNRVTAETNYQYASRNYTYDAVGDLTSLTDRDGRVTTYQYDNVGHRTAEKWLNAQGSAIRTFHYSYDAVGQLTAASDPAASTTQSFSTWRLSARRRRRRSTPPPLAFGRATPT